MNYKNLLSILLFALLLFSACDNINKTENKNDEVKIEEPQTEEAKIAAADALMKKIEAGSGYNIEKKRYQNPDPELYYDLSVYTTYRQGEELVKLTEERGEEGYHTLYHFYYQAGQPVLLQIVLNYMDEQYGEYNIYVDKGTPFAAIGGEVDPHDEPKFSKGNLEKTSPEKALASFGKWKEQMDEMPKRLAKAEIEKE